MSKINIIIIGGGGHGLSVADVILADPIYNLLGYIDQNSDAPLSQLGLRWLGDDEAMATTGAIAAHIGVGQIKSPSRRQALFGAARKAGLDLPAIVSTQAYVSPSARTGEGSLIMQKATVNPCATIGQNTIINTAAVIEHGVKVGDHCHIAPNATLLGDVRIGEGTFIGSGAIILEGLIIGSRVVVGAGTIIKRDVEDGMVIRGSDLS